jgi:hypothetical protein
MGASGSFFLACLSSASPFLTRLSPPVKDLRGHIVEFAGDQLGSRHIQQKLETATSEDKQLVFDELMPNVLQLSTDVFANYVVQKFFEQGNQVQKTLLANALEGHVLRLSLQMYGCRVVQKVVFLPFLTQQRGSMLTGAQRPWNTSLPINRSLLSTSSTTKSSSALATSMYLPRIFTDVLFALLRYRAG